MNLRNILILAIKNRLTAYDSDEEDKKQRVVLPEKAKRLEEINALVKQLKNAKKIKDVVKANQGIIIILFSSDYHYFLIN